MKVIETMKKSINVILHNPFTWLLALAAILGDVWAVFTYDPYSTDISFNIVWLALLALIAEASLVYAFAQCTQGKPSGLIDTVMTTILTSPKILAAKAILMIVPALYSVIVLLLFPVTLTNIAVTLLVIAAALPVLSLSQVWTFFTFCGILIQNYSIGEAITHGWRIIREHIGRVICVVLLFIAVDLILIATLITTQAVTYESALIYTVTPEMAEFNKELQYGGGPTEPGDYFTLNRLSYGILGATIKGRGVELLSIPLHFTSNAAVGVAVAILGIPLLLLRVSTLTLTYLEIAEPVAKLPDRIGEVRKRPRQNNDARTDG